MQLARQTISGSSCRSRPHCVRAAACRIDCMRLAALVAVLLAATDAMALPKSLRAVLGGSGSAIMGEAAIVDAVCKLAGTETPVVAYLGTATYDFEKFREGQVKEFRRRGCEVVAVDVARTAPPPADVAAALERCDAVLVSGGNTLFAVDRWTAQGVDAALEKAMRRGAVLCGGSAGAICWFDGGHSDSMDPDWYADVMIAGGGAADPAYEVAPGEKPWPYVRCPCLGFLPGLACPHHDRTQSNGVLRAEDFAGMLLRHPGEQGVCIDHFAALVVDGEDYAVLALDGKPGTLVAGGTEPDFSGAGTPAIWLKSVEGGRVVAKAAPAAGKLADILRKPTAVVDDARIARAREENPSNVERP